MKTLFSIFAGLVFAASCASVGSVIEGGKEFTTGVVDGAVKGTSTIVTAVSDDVVNTGEFVVESAVDVGKSVVNTGTGIVQKAAQRIDEETDKLQDPEGK
jgi:phosphodiesterase/alkaline phosphatase D-like protein